MRTVEDHHVDRPEVDAWQHVKLTGTNRSNGLINLRSPENTQHRMPARARTASLRPGGHGEGPPPDPIPNSAVKPLRADGTASQDVGE